MDNGYHDGKGRFVSGNPGKPVGSSKNKLRDEIKDFLSDNWGNLQTWFNELTAKEKVTVLIDLLPYAVPRLKQTEMTIDVTRTEEDIIRQEIAANFEKLFPEIVEGSDNNTPTA